MDPAALYSDYSDPILSFEASALLVFIALPCAAYVGFRLGTLEFHRRGYHKMPPDKVPGATSLGAMLALLGLLLGFAFSSALNWGEGRQRALVQEAMAIGTAFLMTDLLAEPGRTELQEEILAYAKTRVPDAEDLETAQALEAFLRVTFNAQADIWPATLRALEGAPDPVRTSVARSITEMLDAHTIRIAAAAQNIPGPAQLMVLVVALTAIFIVGNRSALQGRQLTWRTFVFAGVLSVVILVIMDLDLSHQGTIRTNTDTMQATILDMESALAARQP